MQPPVIILILAAGASTRMRGGDKLLEPVAGEAMLRRQARLAAGTGCPVIVALPPSNAARAAVLAGLSVVQVPVPDAAQGMAASLRRGLAAARALPCDPRSGLMILPADMPEFTAGALDAVVAAFAQSPDRIIRGMAADGQAGHPAVFPADLWDALDGMTGDQGGRAVLAAHHDRISPLPLPGRMAVTDLDTPEDWALWRASGCE